MRFAYPQFIFPAALALLLILPRVGASQQQDSLDIVKSHSRLFTKGMFDVQASREFFERVICGPSLEGVNFPLRFVRLHSVAPEADNRNPEQKLNDLFLVYINYPGGTLLCQAVQLGLDFFSYSKEITTYGKGNLHTELNFIGSGRRFVRTGIYYDF